ncbi:hypothetical protein Mal48_27860 [Thalassoglobus polymorphus]|uniref:Uncharacterized protein n=1 Tax=Thalassoglobus polymorphus TaxID=2527994 RepID=A0A517QPI0_9PLAN|nr:hypothetical protein Mal48_27860 [Thalassoglobus polymorphus]
MANSIFTREMRSPRTHGRANCSSDRIVSVFNIHPVLIFHTLFILHTVMKFVTFLTVVIE